MLLVTLHGGNPDKHSKHNNIHAYDRDGKLLSNTVLEDNNNVDLDELRGICLHGQYLYVVIANIGQSCIVCYEGTDTRFRYVSRFASPQATHGILHPFDISFDEAGHCYISSQDTNVVTRLEAVEGGKTGKPAPLASALPKNGKFLPSTFVASAIGTLTKPGTTPVPPPAGLEYEEGKAKHSVRGVLWTHNALYVADEPAGRVKAYDRDGNFLGQSNPVQAPVHIVEDQGRLYVSAANGILSAKIPNSSGSLLLEPVPGIHIKETSGMAFTPKGHFYVASRGENRIFKFDSNFHPLPFECQLPKGDCPEFLMHL